MFTTFIPTRAALFSLTAASLMLAVSLLQGAPAAAQATGLLTQSEIKTPEAPASSSALPMTPEKKPQPTAPGYIALLYHRMTAQLPPFEDWAKTQPEYLKASPYDREMIANQLSGEMQKTYGLIASQEPIVIRTPVKLSKYSISRKGYFIEDFTPETFYSVSFAGKNYAIVPQDLMNHQWVGIGSEREQEEVQKMLNQRLNTGLLYLYLIPTSADKTAPLRINDRDYWLMSGRVSRMALYNYNNERLIWESGDASANQKMQKELLDLYK
jgi:hypothetical protein